MHGVQDLTDGRTIQYACQCHDTGVSAGVVVTVFSSCSRGFIIWDDSSWMTFALCKDSQEFSNRVRKAFNSYIFSRLTYITQLAMRPS